MNDVPLGSREVSALSLEDLVANRTMTPEIAATLRDAVARRASFLVFAGPRLAGKTTVTRAMLDTLPAGTPLRVVGDDGLDFAELIAHARGGYLVVPEISRYPVAPGYIWGAPVRRAFAAIFEGCALAVALHADAPEDALAIVAQNRVPQADIARLDLLVHLRSIGSDWRAPERRVVAGVYRVAASGGVLATPMLHRA